MLPPPLDSWCRSHIGDYRVLSTHDWPHGLSRIWQVEANGTRYFVKNPSRVGKWQREVFVYRNWVPHFADHAPVLTATHDDAPHALLLTALDGRCMEDVTLTPRQKRAAWEDAGHVMARLHAIPGPWFGSMGLDGQPQEATTQTGGTFWAAKFADWIERGLKMNCLTPEEVAIANRNLADAGILNDAPCVATHGDVSPRNWIASDAGVWQGLIDFEGARWNVPMIDFIRWYDNEFLVQPDLEDAFWRGYGQEPSAHQRQQILWLRLQASVSGIVWAVEHNDPAFAQRNRDGLKRAAAERKL